jgi:hypothetical protein
MINITYAVTVCNESKEITELINFLHPKIQKDDERELVFDLLRVQIPPIFS